MAAAFRIWWRLGRFALGALAVGLAWGAALASARLFVLSTCSTRDLWAAVGTANGNGQSNEIVLKQGCTYKLSSSVVAELDIANPHTLWIYGHGDATISGDSTARGIVVEPGGSLRLGSLTLDAANTCKSGCPMGDAAVNNEGTLVVNNSTIEHNMTGINNSTDPAGSETPTATVTDSTVSGNTNGGIANLLNGAATVSYSSVTGNTGGGIDNYGVNSSASMSVFASTISGNSALCGAGAGVYNSEDAHLTLSASTVSDNKTTCTNPKIDNGGGIYNGGTATVINSTVAGNSAYTGGGIYQGSTGRIVIQWSTVSGNIATSPDAFSGADIRSDLTDGVLLKASIIANGIAGNASGGDCTQRATRAIVDEGYNLADDGTCNLFKSQHSLSSTSAGLSSAGLASNGGPTQTIALLSSSPAVDYVPLSLTPPKNDQRLLPRPDASESLVDIGAYEFQDS